MNDSKVCAKCGAPVSSWPPYFRRGPYDYCSLGCCRLDDQNADYRGTDGEPRE